MTTGETCTVVWIIYNPSKNSNEPDEIFSDNNESTARMVQEAGRRGLLRDGNGLVMGDFN